DQYPAADRQLVRQLVRNARLEREKQRPPRAFRELFRVLKTLMAGEGEIADAPSDDRAHGEDDIDDENIGS
ncbi:MAG TPA: DUF615 domain-containing protein, partial [Chiayiivirga sp.]|nr:DUF615 domain-containing protein [Chiayiivirga sp.]